MIDPFFKTDSTTFKLLESLAYQEPVKFFKNLLGGGVGYPIAEYLEKRQISAKYGEIVKHYKNDWTTRRRNSLQTLINVLEFSKVKVPYYAELFQKTGFDPQNLNKDIKYFDDLPILTKNIITEQGARLLSADLDGIRHHKCKTGGSTGQSCFIYYDQPAADYAAAIVKFARRSIGKYVYRSELHFACKFPDQNFSEWPTREDFKSFAMNRSNIFFDRLDDEGLSEILKIIKKRRPYIVHGHPSTIYALANYLQNTDQSQKYFSIFESSGELLEDHMRKKIIQSLGCKVINRYGLAELGVVGYELFKQNHHVMALDSECWAGNIGNDNQPSEIVITGYRNQLMPMIKYATGDLGEVYETNDGRFIKNMTGRIHDIITINGVKHATHYVQDVLDHRVGGIQEFQVDTRYGNPILRIVLEPTTDQAECLAKLTSIWSDAFEIRFVGHDDLILVGNRAKFRHVVTG